MEYKTVTVGVLVSVYLLASIYLLSTSAVDLLAQQRGNISIIQATALPLVNTEGNQVKVIINYSIGDESIVGQRINAVMGIYDRINGTLIKLTSFPDGIILNTGEGTIQLASTLTDPKIQNISTIVTLTNAEKSEKYSNDVRSDLNLRAILPTSLPGLNETLPPSESPQPTSESPQPNISGQDFRSDAYQVCVSGDYNPDDCQMMISSPATEMSLAEKLAICKLIEESSSRSLTSSLTSCMAAYANEP
jgi:hypothetical protein